MGLFNYLFSFDGRINRAKMWAFLIVAFVEGIIIDIAIQMTLGFGTILEVMQQKITWSAAVSMAPLFFPVMAALYILVLYIHLAIMTKRLHDRDKSAWWLLIFVVLPGVLNIPLLLDLPATMAHLSDVMRAVQNHLPPPDAPQHPIATIGSGIGSLISLWAFVELFILRGTEGPNRFGPDPLAGKR